MLREFKILLNFKVIFYLRDIEDLPVARETNGAGCGAAAGSTLFTAAAAARAPSAAASATLPQLRTTQTAQTACLRPAPW